MPGSTRIGNLLVKKRKITPQQLFQAIRFQQERRLQELQQGKAHTEKSELGEILIELGFISRHQLKTSLSGQRKLRKKVAALAMTFVAPLLTVACGGGASGSTNPSTAAKQLSAQSSPATTDNDSSSSGVSVSSSSVSISSTNLSTTSSQNANSLDDMSTVSSAKSSAASKPQTASSALSSAIAQIPGHSSLSSIPLSFSSSSVSKSSASSSVVKSSSSAAKSISSSLSRVGHIDGPVLINWSPPTKRVNGDYMDIAEVGGYELRYKLKGDAQYKSIKITNNYTDSYYFDYLKGNYLFEIAAFDTSGLYSDFVTIE